MHLNREQMEAHLVLHGWQPAGLACGGAYRDGIAVFAKQYEVVIETRQLHGMWRARSWYMNDKYFWPLAHRCTELDNQGMK